MAPATFPCSSHLAAWSALPGGRRKRREGAGSVSAHQGRWPWAVWHLQGVRDGLSEKENLTLHDPSYGPLSPAPTCFRMPPLWKVFVTAHALPKTLPSQPGFWKDSPSTVPTAARGHSPIASIWLWSPPLPSECSRSPCCPIPFRQTLGNFAIFILLTSFGLSPCENHQCVPRSKDRGQLPPAGDRAAKPSQVPVGLGAWFSPLASGTTGQSNLQTDS